MKREEFVKIKTKERRRKTGKKRGKPGSNWVAPAPQSRNYKTLEERRRTARVDYSGKKGDKFPKYFDRETDDLPDYIVKAYDRAAINSPDHMFCHYCSGEITYFDFQLGRVRLPAHTIGYDKDGVEFCFCIDRESCELRRETYVATFYHTPPEDK